MTTALVSGASVAGLANAYWLARQGYSVTVVERYDGLRPGGQAIDVRGPALSILDRMGLLEAAEAKKTAIRGASFVDRDGNELSRDTEATPTGGVIDNPDVEILRDDLVELLDGALEDVEFIYGDSITALDDRGDAVAVTFEKANARDFGLVVGADGLHSNVRKLAFGPEFEFIRPIATFMAIFTVPNFLDLDYWQMYHQSDSTMAGVYSARDNTEARAMFGFMDPELQLDYRDTAAQFAELERRMADDGWVRPQLLEYMRTAPDFYFDGVASLVPTLIVRGSLSPLGEDSWPNEVKQSLQSATIGDFPAAQSGAANEERTAERIAVQNEDLEALVKEQDRRSKRK